MSQTVLCRIKKSAGTTRGSPCEVTVKVINSSLPGYPECNPGMAEFPGEEGREMAAVYSGR